MTCRQTATALRGRCGYTDSDKSFRRLEVESLMLEEPGDLRVVGHEGRTRDLMASP